MKSTRIEVKNRPEFPEDSSILKTIKEDAHIIIDAVETVKAYNLQGDFKENEINLIRNDLLSDLVYQENKNGWCYYQELDYNFAVEVAYKNGVTDNVGRTTAQGISYILNKEINFNSVRASTIYFFKGKVTEAEIKKIAEKVLCNTLIEDYYIFNKNSFKPVEYFKTAQAAEITEYYKAIDLNVTDEQLMKISEDGVLSFSLEEMVIIREYYQSPIISEARKNLGLPASPTDIELELFAQTWSEHCKHKIFAADIEYKNGNETKQIHSLFKTYIKDSADKLKKTRKDLLSLFKDNAGVVQFNDEYAYCVKAETHNSPSALDPYGGAMTGIVGVNRDILGTGMGAYPIYNTDVFCFGSPFTEDENVPEGLMHPRRIFRGVHRGVKDGGNESGIPTVNGSITFDESFLGKPLVFCGTGGILPLKSNGRDAYEKYVNPGDLIVMCGGLIGKDGIHGATFSSAHLTETSPTSAVQIGDPITQKKMIDFTLEARDLGLYSGLTDNGAGGLGSSVGEMAQFTDGATLYLDKCPLKYPGLKPWEILISEAQERMTIAVPKVSIDQFLALAKRRSVDCAVIGEFTDNGTIQCYYKDTIVCYLDLDMLHEGNPKLKLKAEWKETIEVKVSSKETDFNLMLKKLLGRPNVASKESWVRIYDHEVQARTVNKPFTGKDNDGPSDGAVLKIFPHSNEGLAVTHGIVPRYSRFDTFQMAANAIDEAVRQAIICGADPDALVGLDNFCWPDPVEGANTPDGKYKMAQLVRACEAVHDITIAYNCPCISGKDSMKNDYRKGSKKISVLPTLLFTATGIVRDITKTVSFYFKKPEQLIYVIGDTRAELGASEYFEMLNIKEGAVPKVLNPEETFLVYKKIAKLIEKRLLVSAHDLSDGGLSVALSEAAFSGNTGAEISLDAISSHLSVEEKLFSETPSRILVTVDNAKKEEFLQVIGEKNVFFLGKTNAHDMLVVKSGSKTVINEKLSELKSIWKNSLTF